MGGNRRIPLLSFVFLIAGESPSFLPQNHVLKTSVLTAAMFVTGSLSAAAIALDGSNLSIEDA